MLKTRPILYGGFSTVLFLMVVLIVIGLNVLDESMARLKTVVHTNNLKSELFYRMRVTARERTVSLQKMIILDGEEEREKEWANLSDFGGAFADAREAMLSLDLSDKERALLEKQADLSSIVGPLQHRIAELAIFEELDKAHSLLLEQAIPLQDKVFDILSELITIQKTEADKAVESTRVDYQRAMFTMVMVAGVVFVICILIVWFVIQQITKTESELRYHRNHLEDLVNDRTKALEEALVLAEQANVVKSEFVSTVSHELRTPLTSIRVSLRLIEGDAMGELPAPVSSMLEIASNNTERLLLLVNDILDIQKTESSEMTFKFIEVEVMSLLERVLNDSTALAEQCNVCLKITQDVTQTGVSADPDRLVQVLNNLLSNAVKFSSAGDEIEIAVIHKEDNIRISVTDHGPGIPEEFQPKVFDKFTQADSSDTRKVGGTGLGLNISKAIIEKHGGDIGFISKTGVGATFYIELPILKKKTAK